MGFGLACQGKASQVVVGVYLRPEGVGDGKKSGGYN